MIKQELTYWVTLALMPKMWTKRKNEIYVKCFTHVPQISIIDLFENKKCWSELGLSEIEITQMTEACNQLANNSFLVEELQDQGYHIIPLRSDKYPKTLKKNLGTSAPTVLFAKGNLALLQQPSVAIVGSRKADGISLTFTDNVARKASSERKVVVSGFAKGVDRQALDSSLTANGQRIIVLPQGITTFASGFKQYFKQIAQGNILVISTFAPKAPWRVEFAMARNSTIYGLASEIYVAQSDDKGGTWSGVVDGLRKQRAICVRWPEKGEKNANILLVQKGATAVDLMGNTINIAPENAKTPEQAEKENINVKVLNYLTKNEKATSKDILGILNVDWTDSKMKKYLGTIRDVEKIMIKNRVYYQLKGKVSNDLFSSFE